jgi:low temperature requirement protein LtrA
VAIAAAGLVLLFALWWLYFLEPAGQGLSSHRNRSFYWGYGHYLVFASLAAIGAGLEVAVQSGAVHAEVPDAAIAYSVAVPVAVFLVLLWALHAPLVPEVVIQPLKTLIAVVLVLLLPLASPLIGLGGAIIGIAVVAAALVAATLVDRAVRASRTAVASA